MTFDNNILESGQTSLVKSTVATGGPPPLDTRHQFGGSQGHPHF